MSVLQVGRHRTGGYLLWTLIENLHRLNGIKKKSYVRNHHFQAQKQHWNGLSIDHFEIDSMSVEDDGIFCDIEVLMRERIMDLSAYVDACNHVWSDSSFHPRHCDVLPAFQHIIYQLRDPRDSLVSLADWEFKPYRMKYGWKSELTESDFIENRLDGFMSDWVSHVQGYLNVGDQYNIKFIRYEEFVDNPKLAIKHIAYSIGVDAPDDMMEEIAAVSTFEGMQKTVPDHLGKGKTKSWLTRLTNNQINRAENIAGSMLEKMGYLK